jgi:lipoate---protein ligase
MKLDPYPYDRDLMEATREDGKERLRVEWAPETAVVLGRSGVPERDLNLDAVVADGVPIYRRVGGGCPVVLDRGNLVVSLCLPGIGFGRIPEYNKKLANWLLAALEAAGLPDLVRAGHTDLVAGSRKVSGSCTYRSRGLLYFSATLLISADLSLLDRYLAHPPREPKYRRGRPHGKFVANLPGLINMDLFERALRAGVAGLIEKPRTVGKRGFQLSA